ncbi:DDE_Tnp_1_7 domain-containing protein [Trichonephila clavata]|uniref:DDE_Tnp_1_7 domain-containing protein n=1 Tax=Trichonephila clavata TaxID=2740835 RepID=A0A8X6HMK2_TRICU|nr:DDE_Tnp_1_7 domain-containing protein [Trichonephila clavata]
MVQAICDEPEDENEVGRSDTSDDELIQESDHDTESEQELRVEIEEEIEKESEITKEYFLGKDKTTTWNKNPLTSKYTKISKKNIVKIFPGLKSCAKYITDEKSAFEMFFTNDIIQNIVECTNMEIEKLRVNYDRPRDAKNTTTNEVLAFIGIIILAGVKKRNHTNFLELWTTDGTGSEIFRSCMNCNRFLFLLSAIRFDDKNTRKERQLTDKLAAIRFTLDRFVENCKNNYSLG